MKAAQVQKEIIDSYFGRLKKYGYTNGQENIQVLFAILLLDAYNSFSDIQDAKFEKDVRRILRKLECCMCDFPSGTVFDATEGINYSRGWWEMVTPEYSAEVLVKLREAIKEKVNREELATVAYTGSYNDLLDTPTQKQADWEQEDDEAVDFIKNKPTIPAEQIQVDWTQTDSTQLDYIQNKPIYDAYINSTSSSKILTVTGLDDVKEPGSYSVRMHCSTSVVYGYVMDVVSNSVSVTQYIHHIGAGIKSYLPSTIEASPNHFLTRSISGNTWGDWSSARYLSTDSCASEIALSVDDNYIVSAILKNQNGHSISASSIDLPLESVVVNGKYDSATKKVVLTLQNGSTIEFSVADLVNGLQKEITSDNKLSADLIDDYSASNKFVTAEQRTKIDEVQNIKSIGDNLNLDPDGKLSAVVNDGKLSIKVGTSTYEFTANQSTDTSLEINTSGIKEIEGTVTVDVTEATPKFTVTGLDDVKEKGICVFYDAVSDISSQFTAIVTVDSVNDVIVQYIRTLPYYWKMLGIPNINIDTDFIYRQYTNDSWGDWTINQAILPASRVDGLSNSKIIIKQGDTEKGSFTLNQPNGDTIVLDDNKNTIVTISKSGDNYYASKTSEDISKAFNNGTCVYVSYGSRIYELDTVVSVPGNYVAQFSRTNQTSIQSFTIHGNNATYSEQAIVKTSDLNNKADKVTGTEDHLASLTTDGGYQDSGYCFSEAQGSATATVTYALASDLDNKADKILVSNETETAKAIDPNVYYVWGEVASLTISLNAPTDTTIVNEYMFSFVSGSTATSLSIPSTMPDGTAIKWNAAPSIVANRSYQVSIQDGIALIVSGNE